MGEVLSVVDSYQRRIIREELNNTLNKNNTSTVKENNIIKENIPTQSPISNNSSDNVLDIISAHSKAEYQSRFISTSAIFALTTGLLLHSVNQTRIPKSLATPPLVAMGSYLGYLYYHGYTNCLRNKAQLILEKNNFSVKEK